MPTLSAVVLAASTPRPKSESRMPKTSATSADSRPVGKGRVRVRVMSASLSFSSSMLRALAPATTNAVPTSAPSAISQSTGPGAATVPRNVVTRTRRVTLGLQSSTRASSCARAATGISASGATSEALISGFLLLLVDDLRFGHRWGVQLGRGRIGLVVVGQALLEVLDALAQTLANVAQPTAAKEKQDHQGHEQPVTDRHGGGSLPR